MPDKSFRFSRHARNRMRRDDVVAESVYECVRGPESVTESVFGRRNYWRPYGGGYLRVTIAEEDEVLVVVSVVVRRKGPRSPEQ